MQDQTLPGKVLASIIMGIMALGQAMPNLEIIGNARGVADKVYWIIDHTSQIDSLSESGVKINNFRGNIEFRDVCFSYPSRLDLQVLKNFNFKVKAGQSVALMGSSGCGKSTVVLLDGKNIKDLNVRWLRQQIGVVSQEPVLFSTTIAENIRYGRWGVTQEEVENAAKEANAHDFIMKFPQGYETFVGEHGAQMSGGQKQRIAIARAQIGRTSITIAHRLSMISNVDIIYCMNNGNDDNTNEDLPKVPLKKILKLNSPEWHLIVIGCISSIVTGTVHPFYSMVNAEFLKDASFFDNKKNSVGTLTTRLATDVTQIAGATANKIGIVLETIATMICVLVIAFIYSWKLCLVVLAFMPLVISAGIIQGKIIQGFYKGDKSCMEEAGKIYRTGMKKSIIQSILYGFSQAISIFAYAASFAYGAYLVQNEDLKFDDVFSIHSYNEGQEIIGEMQLKNVTFRYPSRPGVAVLDEFNLTVKVEDTVAIIGASGSGKSTICQILDRFYDPDQGEVLLDGRNLKNFNLQWFRSKVSIVSQEPVLFDLSIKENIAYGDNSRDVGMDEIISAAKTANIHNFITSLPQLSGGQKQRIAIARALISNPKILLLDEATSALDTENEMIVQKALENAQKGRTSIVITHRLSSLQNYDRIALVHKGQVVELGSHSELLTKMGIYYKLYHQYLKKNSIIVSNFQLLKNNNKCSYFLKLNKIFNITIENSSFFKMNKKFNIKIEMFYFFKMNKNFNIKI
ncbi:hypothetical protein KUTeg_008440 [Tegillarca granosa]|uniref:Uncharacterized protein n=1 Tax=Tegillarca granosa TaxID=220873 RepID=A0ABQ9F952_TEGGR|nr:hypothetical protein KUTeg_008440 [Tegillarca granosa]